MSKNLVVITGASAGIGKALATAYAQRGYDLLITARRLERLQQIKHELEEAFGTTVHVLDADLLSSDAPQRIYDVVTREIGRTPNILVNNAGFGTHGAFATLPLEKELGQVQVNISALVALSRLFLPDMIERQSGSIINVASCAAFQAGPYMATYYATKAFVLSFSEALASELKGTGVTVTAHCPGATETEFGDVSGNGKTRLFQEGIVASVESVAEHLVKTGASGTTVAIPGIANKLGAFMTRLMPRKWITSVVRYINTVK